MGFIRKMEIKFVAEKEQTGKLFLSGGSQFIGRILLVPGKSGDVSHFLASRSATQIFTRLNALPSPAYGETEHIPHGIACLRTVKWPTAETRRPKHDGTKRSNGHDFHQQKHKPGDLCSYLPRTRMRVLDRSTILNGQLAILA